jgi:PPOX class probable FMN-dependent enzyme
MDMQNPRFSQFQGVVSSMEEIREFVPEPAPSGRPKVIAHIDHASRKIIEKSSFIVAASATADGYPDLSPKGDPEGFVRILDDKHLAFPERPGNRRLDTFTNLLKNPYLAILFLNPGKGKSLRVTGECRIVRDQKLRESMVVQNRPQDRREAQTGGVPEFAVVMHVERVLMQCPKCIVRSRLWQPAFWSGAQTNGAAEQTMTSRGPSRELFKRLRRTSLVRTLVALPVTRRLRELNRRAGGG